MRQFRTVNVVLCLLLGQAVGNGIAQESTRFWDSLIVACPNIVGYAGTPPGPVRVDTENPVDQPAAQICANPIIAAFDASLEAENAWLTQKLRDAAKAQWSEPDKVGKALRCYAAIDLSELNVLRTWLVDFKAEVSAATSLADLKTRVAALPNTPDRTMIQLRNLIDSCLDGGTQD